MTNITISKNGTQLWYRCEGHCDYAKIGNDIVCSAVSMMSHSFAELINHLDKHSKVKIKRFLSYDGLVDIIVDDTNNELKNVITMQVLGFSALEEQFSKNIHLEWGEIKKTNS